MTSRMSIRPEKKIITLPFRLGNASSFLPENEGDARHKDLSFSR